MIGYNLVILWQNSQGCVRRTRIFVDDDDDDHELDDYFGGI